MSTADESHDSADRERARRFGDRWIAEAELGAGGMATVYGARNREGTERVAIKLMHARAAADPELVAGFGREADLHGRLDHGTIVGLFDRGTDERGVPWFAMERLDGVNVEEVYRAAGRPLPAREAFKIASQALSGLQYLHEHGIIHRDVKPANLFVTREGQVKLLDLGIALSVDDELDEDTSSRLGTPGFMAPEQAMNAARGVEAVSDVFAMGATLYLLLSGRRIREGTSQDEEFLLAATTPPPSLARAAPHLPIEVIRVVDRALAWHPKDRYPSADAMREAVRQVIPALDDTWTPDDDEVRPSLNTSLATFQASRGEFTDAAEYARCVRAARHLFRSLNALFGMARKWGWDDPRVRERRDAWRDELRTTQSELGGTVQWSLRPYSFEFGGETIWEPEEPLDTVPYWLFSSGFRSIELLHGVTDDEIDRLLALMITDPTRDLPAEDDLAVVFVNDRYPHVDARILTSFDMELLDEFDDIETEFAAVRDDLRQGLAELDRADDALRADFGRQAAVESQAIDVGVEAPRQAESPIRVHFEDPAWDALRENTRRDAPGVASYLAAGLRDALDNGDEDLLTEPLRERVQHLTLTGDALGLAELLDATAAEIARDEHEAVFADLLTARSVRLLVGRSEAAGPDGRMPVEREDYRRVLSALPGAFFAVLLEEYVRDRGTPTGAIVLGWLRERIEGNEEDVAQVLPAVGRTAGARLIEALRRGRPEVARRMARTATLNRHDEVRLDALRLRLELEDECAEECGALLASQRDETRAAVLALLLEFAPQAGAGVLYEIMLQDRFHDLALAERQRHVMALFTLDAGRAEDVCTELLAPQRFREETHVDATRILAGQLLGALGTRPATRDLLEREATRWLRNSRRMRRAAREALADFEARAGGTS